MHMCGVQCMMYACVHLSTHEHLCHRACVEVRGCSPEFPSLFFPRGVQGLKSLGLFTC